MERRATKQRATIETRADGKPVITGYAAVYYRAGDPGTEFQLWQDTVERIKPGAFDAAIKSDDVRGLFNHDANFVLGRTTAGTMTLSVDERGLKYEITPPDSETARGIVESIRRGDVDGSSFGFAVRKQSWERSTNGSEIRWLEDVQLYDVGPVTYPAYAATSSEARTSNDAYLAWLEEMRSRWSQEVDARLRLISLDMESA